MSTFPRIGLRQLHYFNAVAEEGSISGAAAKLHLSQPPLTVQIQLLEQELGVQLLVRHRRGVELTAAGVTLAAEARAIFDRTFLSVERVRQVGRGEVGALRIGIVSSIMWGQFVEVIKRYQAQYPGVQWSLHELNPKAQIQGLLDHKIDVGFWRVSPTAHSEIEGVRVTSESIAAVVPTSNPLATRKKLRLSDLAQESLVMLNPDISDFGVYLMDACRAAGFEPRVIHKANEPATLLALVSAGVGVALLPESLSRIPWPDVKFLPIPRTSLRGDVFMFARKSDTSVALANFLALTKEVSAL